MRGRQAGPPPFSRVESPSRRVWGSSLAQDQRPQVKASAEFRADARSPAAFRHRATSPAALEPDGMIRHSETGCLGRGKEPCIAPFPIQHQIELRGRQDGKGPVMKGRLSFTFRPPAGTPCRQP